MSYRQPIRRMIAALGAVLACASLACASATLLLEEPYGKLGFFTATGHAAVYLSDVCADSPLVLRLCAPGETGVVLSRYDGVAGYDWLAIPLIPYLYAVDRPQDIPLFADAKMVASLRDRYRRDHLEDVAPDTEGDEAPGGNWYQLVGSSYDRTMYGYEIETTREQDTALVRMLNASQNRSHFHLVSRNCADFAKDIINFYYPKTLHRSVIADAGITTPKQMAKLLTRFDSRHPEMKSSRFVISQVPGSMPRSSAAHGVVESFLKSKKYIVPSAFASPVFAGCVFAVYVGTGAGRFEPDRDAMVFVPGGDPQLPLGRKERKAYQRQLRDLLAEAETVPAGQNIDKSLSRWLSRATLDFDEQGAPVLRMQVGESEVNLGVTTQNVLSGDAPPQLTRALLAARLHSELHHSPPRGLSQAEVARDWRLLQQAMREDDSPLSAHSVPGYEDVRGNGP